MFPFVATTHEITVSVRPVYLDGESDPMRRRFVFGYHIRIENGGSESIRLLRRRWLIHHAEERAETVEGDGVIGQQPLIPAGSSHAYSSFCILTTFEGSMEGSYTMERPDGEVIEVQIPRFVLRARAN